MDCARPLSGLGVLVTRPLAQAQALCERIEAAGGQPIRFPALEIVPAADTDALIRRLPAAGADELLIFVSANAVRFSMQALRAAGRALPAAACVAVGPATVAALREIGLRPEFDPRPPYDSEALLRIDAMQAVAEKCILIVRGDGGRALLGDTLTQRGARVSYLEAYRRRMPRTDPAALLERWASGGVGAVTVTSSQSLDNLRRMIGDRGLELLRRTPVVVLSARTAALATRLGIEAPVLLTEEASDQAIVAALEAWRGNDCPRERAGAGRG